MTRLLVAFEVADHDRMRAAATLQRKLEGCLTADDGFFLETPRILTPVETDSVDAWWAEWYRRGGRMVFPGAKGRGA